MSVTDLQLVEDHAEMCPAGCGHDRFDHDFMGYACGEYLEWLEHSKPWKYGWVAAKTRRRCMRDLINLLQLKLGE